MLIKVQVGSLCGWTDGNVRINSRMRCQHCVGGALGDRRVKLPSSSGRLRRRVGKQQGTKGGQECLPTACFY